MRELQNYTAGLLYKSAGGTALTEERRGEERSLPDLVDAEDDWEVSLFYL